MRTFFTRYGKVVDATVMVDRETGRSKGFGFVTFEDNSNDSQLVGKLGLILDDKQVLVPLCIVLYIQSDLSIQIEVKTAQPRSQRDQQRHNAASPGNNFNAGQAAVSNPAAMGGGMPFMAMNNTGAGDMSMMYQRMMNGMGTPYGAMMGGGMGMMGGFNPMMGMGMGMGRFGMGGMGGMSGAGVGGMTPMAAATAGGMGGNMGMGGAVGGMRLGMGPIGMGGASGGGMGGGMVAGGGMAGAAAAMAGAGGGMGAMGAMGMRQNMGGMMGAGAGRGGRPGMNQGPGPARITNRGQHGYHPYAR
jgi:RNA-binding protein Musashi